MHLCYTIYTCAHLHYYNLQQHICYRYAELLLICMYNSRTPSEDSGNTSGMSKEVKGRNHTYYQVLIDSRDVPHIVSNVMKMM